jgi:hypothetical protein
MELGSDEVSGNSTLASLIDDGSVPTGLEYDLDTTIGLYSSHVGVKCVFGEPDSLAVMEKYPFAEPTIPLWPLYNLAGFLTLTIYEMSEWWIAIPVRTIGQELMRHYSWTPVITFDSSVRIRSFILANCRRLTLDSNRSISFGNSDGICTRPYSSS